MNLQNSILLKRTVATTLLILLTVCVIGNHALHSEVNYVPLLYAVPPVVANGGDGPIAGVDEPADAWQTLRLHFLGNITTGTMLGSTAYGTFNDMVAGSDPEYFLEKAADHLQKDDWTVGALNNVFSDRGKELSIVSKQGREQSWYLGGTGNVDVLTAGGIDVLSLATEHIDDYGKDGRMDTQATLEEADLLWGNDEKAIYLEEDGFRIGIYMCSTENTSDSISEGNDEASTDDEMTAQETTQDHIAEWTSSAAQTCDFVILYVYRDTKDSYEADTTFIKKAQEWINSGADCVFGIGSEFLQPVTYYGDGLIVSSLGTFFSGADRFPEKYTVIYRLSLFHDNGVLKRWDAEAIPYAAYEQTWQPTPLEGDEKEAVLAFLRGESDSIK